ncbi:hypothetical protein MZM54_03215 [[Brevibacterium] frigoritolerans]|nr:hypothetical protein [Peribacillus frigoritolerans]
MDHVIIVNGNGKRKEIKVGILNELTLVAVEESPDTYCLGCKKHPINPEELEVFLIQESEKLKNMLNDREQFTKENDHILLCQECSEKIKKQYALNK